MPEVTVLRNVISSNMRSKAQKPTKRWTDNINEMQSEKTKVCPRCCHRANWAKHARRVWFLPIRSYDVINNTRKTYVKYYPAVREGPICCFISLCIYSACMVHFMLLPSSVINERMKKGTFYHVILNFHLWSWPRNLTEIWSRWNIVKNIQVKGHFIQILSRDTDTHTADRAQYQDQKWSVKKEGALFLKQDSSSATPSCRIASPIIELHEIFRGDSMDSTETPCPHGMKIPWSILLGILESLHGKFHVFSNGIPCCIKPLPLFYRIAHRLQRYVITTKMSHSTPHYRLPFLLILRRLRPTQPLKPAPNDVQYDVTPAQFGDDKFTRLSHPADTRKSMETIDDIRSEECDKKDADAGR